MFTPTKILEFGCQTLFCRKRQRNLQKPFFNDFFKTCLCETKKVPYEQTLEKAGPVHGP